MFPITIFSDVDLENSNHKIKWFDKYCLDSGWIDANFPFPSKETIDSLIEDAVNRNFDYVVDKAFERLSQLVYASACIDLEIKAINEFLQELGVSKVDASPELPFPD